MKRAIAPTNSRHARAAGESWRDTLGITASVACAVHCAATPLVLGALPTLGLSWLADGLLHQAMFAVCLGLAAAAFVPGVLRHGSWLPILIGTLGIVIIGGAAFGLEGACCGAHTPAVAWVTPFGGLFLIAAHLMNRQRFGRCC
jgi:hypothetical protein